jgi:hypothetical protein
MNIGLPAYTPAFFRAEIARDTDTLSIETNYTKRLQLSNRIASAKAYLADLEAIEAPKYPAT